MNGQPLPITGDGSETRDWTYVMDIVNGLLAMGVKDKAIGQAINLGSGKEHKVVDMARKVNELAGNKAGIKFVERRDWDVKKRLCSSIGRAQDVLDYRPAVSFEDGLKSVHSWFKSNWVEIQRSAEF